VDAHAHAGLFGDRHRVNDVQLEPLVDDRLLHRARQVFPDLFDAVRRVEQEGRAFVGEFQHVVAFEEVELVTGDEAGATNQVGALYWARPEAQVRNGHGSRLLRVIDEIALREIRRLFADDLHGVLVGADRAIRAQAPEDGAHDIRRLGVERLIVIETAHRYVVVDADDKMVLRIRLRQLVVNGFDHRRRELFRRQAVAPADDDRQAIKAALVAHQALCNRGYNILIERLAGAAR